MSTFVTGREPSYDVPDAAKTRMPSEFERIAPLRLTAVELQGTAAAGRSRPLLVDGRGPDGTRIPVVMKLLEPGVNDGTPWALCAMRDLVGSLAAKQFGLHAPRSALIEVTEPFVRSTAGRPEHPRLARNIGHHFGSERVDRNLELPPDLPELWRPILSFDAMCFNGDRMGGNPNVLWTGERLVPIDHGFIAPTWTFSLDGTTATTLFGEVAIRTHAGASALRRRGAAFDDLAQLWNDLITDAFLEWAGGQVPEAWAAPREVADLLEFLARRRTIADPQARLLAEVLM